MYRKLALLALLTFLAGLVGCRHHNPYLHKVYEAAVLQSNSMTPGDVLSFCGQYDIVYMGDNQIHVNLIGARVNDDPTILSPGERPGQWYPETVGSADAHISYMSTNPPLGLWAKIDGCGKLIFDLDNTHPRLTITTDMNCSNAPQVPVVVPTSCSYVCNGEIISILPGHSQQVPWNTKCTRTAGSGSILVAKSPGVPVLLTCDQ